MRVCAVITCRTESAHPLYVLGQVASGRVIQVAVAHGDNAFACARACRPRASHRARFTKCLPFSSSPRKPVGFSYRLHLSREQAVDSLAGEAGELCRTVHSLFHSIRELLCQAVSIPEHCASLHSPCCNQISPTHRSVVQAQHCDQASLFAVPRTLLVYECACTPTQWCFRTRCIGSVDVL